jgi:hypothetical protein
VGHFSYSWTRIDTWLLRTVCSLRDGLLWALCVQWILTDLEWQVSSIVAQYRICLLPWPPVLCLFILLPSECLGLADRFTVSLQAALVMGMHLCTLASLLSSMRSTFSLFPWLHSSLITLFWISSFFPYRGFWAILFLSLKPWCFASKLVCSWGLWATALFGCHLWVYYNLEVCSPLPSHPSRTVSLSVECFTEKVLQLCIMNLFEWYNSISPIMRGFFPKQYYFRLFKSHWPWKDND